MGTLPPRAPESTTTPAVATRSSIFHGPGRSPILFGPDGLRAGWSILIYVALLAIFLFAAKFELHWFAVHFHQKMSHDGEVHPALMILAEATTLLIVLLATALMGLLEGRRAAFYGLVGAGRLRQFGIGIVSGFAFLSLLIGILLATHHLTLDRIHMPAAQAWGYAAVWALCFLLVGMTEELMLRGYLLFTLARGIRFWPAAILLAALFGFMHKSNPGESPFGLVAAALIALVFSLSLWRLGHLWWAIGFHLSWDWGESYFYGTADSGMVSTGRLMHAHPLGNLLVSGGSTGPEGSAWVVLVVLLAALFVWFTQPNNGLRLAKSEAVPVVPASN